MKYFLIVVLSLLCGCSTSSRWVFQEQPFTMVVTERKVVEKKLPILFVLHDKEGDWQFLANDENGGMDQVVELCLNDIVKMDTSIAMVADLPKGWKAIRTNTSSTWNTSLYREKILESEKSSSQRVRTDTSYSYHIYFYTNYLGTVHGIYKSMRTGYTTSNNNISDYDQAKLFYGYDTTIIGFNKEHIVPFRVGRTKIYLRNPEKFETVADSVEVEVIQGKKNLYLQRRAP